MNNKATQRRPGKSRLATIGIAMSLVLSGCIVDGNSLESADDSSTMIVAEVNRHFSTGKEHLDEGQLGLALESFKQALTEAPTSVRALNAVGATYDRLGRNDLAERYYRQALALDPDSAQTLNNLGYSLMLMGNYQDAVPLLAKAAKSKDAGSLGPIAAKNYEMALKALQGTTSAKIERASLSSEPSKTAKTSDARQAAKENCVVGPVWLEKSGTRVYSLVTEPSAVAQIALRDLSASVDENVADRSSLANCHIVVRDAYGAVPRLDGPRAETPKPLVKQVKPEQVKPEPTPKGQVVEQADPGKTNKENVVESKPTGKSAAEAPSVDKPAPAKPLAGDIAPKQPAAEKKKPTVDVSNGAGRDKLAARVRSYLQNKGLTVSYITNAASFDHRSTVIFYRQGYQDEATRYANSLPTAVEIEQSDKLATDLRIRLGRDILPGDSAGLLGDSNRKLSLLADIWT